MIDERLKKLCNSLVNYSMNVQKGEKVLIQATDCPEEVSTQLIKEVAQAGGISFLYQPKPESAKRTYSSRNCRADGDNGYGRCGSHARDGCVCGRSWGRTTALSFQM